MTETILTDDFGRRTVFTGEKLVEETSDNERSVKPQWVEVDVWRTQGGQFVVQRTTRYRVRHLDELCDKSEGYTISPATADDTYPCRHCNSSGHLEGGWSQDDRISIDVYETPAALIAGFENDGRFSALSRSILADIAEQDTRVDEVWNTVIVP